MRILGIDPGLANMGWCIASYTQEAGLSVQLMGCIETKKDQRKVLTSVDNTKRTQSVFEQLLGLMWAEEEGQPVLLVDAIAAEEVSYPRNSSSAAKMSLSWAAAACAASTVARSTPRLSPLAKTSRSSSSSMYRSRNGMYSYLKWPDFSCEFLNHEVPFTITSRRSFVVRVSGSPSLRTELWRNSLFWNPMIPASLSLIRSMILGILTPTRLMITRAPRWFLISQEMLLPTCPHCSSPSSQIIRKQSPIRSRFRSVQPPS